VQGLRGAEGKPGSLAPRCRGFGVPRSTFSSRPPAAAVPHSPNGERALKAQIRAIIDAEPAVGRRMITAAMASR
jgi:hypothetical protein